MAPSAFTRNRLPSHIWVATRGKYFVKQSISLLVNISIGSYYLKPREIHNWRFNLKARYTKQGFYKNNLSHSPNYLEDCTLFWNIFQSTISFDRWGFIKNAWSGNWYVLWTILERPYQFWITRGVEKIHVVGFLSFILWVKRFQCYSSRLTSIHSFKPIFSCF